MANTITKQIIMNSSREYIILYSALSDGSTGDLTNSLVLNTTGDLPVTAKLKRLWYSMACPALTTPASTNTAATANLLWAATTNTIFFSLPANQRDFIKFLDVGGLPNPQNTGVTGDVLITTKGFALAAGTTVSMLLHFAKS